MNLGILICLLISTLAFTVYAFKENKSIKIKALYSLSFLAAIIINLVNIFH